MFTGMLEIFICQVITTSISTSNMESFNILETEYSSFPMYIIPDNTRYT